MSTSSSEARRYLGLIGIIALACLGYLTYRLVLDSNPDFLTPPEQALLLNRLEKAASPGPLQTVIVGDSSAGHAIDESLWSRLSGNFARNLALTATYGLEGSLNMIRRAAAARPREAIIIQTPIVAAGDVSFEGYVRSSPSLFTSEHLTILERAEGMGSILKSIFGFPVLRRLIDRVRRGPVEHLADDYVPQQIDAADPQRLKIDSYLTMSLKVAPSFKLRVSWIAEVCARENIICVYAHGPLDQRLCAAWRPLMDEIEAAVLSAGLRMATNTPLCVPESRIGDRYDHVAPDWKSWSTESYFRLVAPSRRQPPG